MGLFGSSGITGETGHAVVVTLKYDGVGFDRFRLHGGPGVAEEEPDWKLEISAAAARAWAARKKAPQPRGASWLNSYRRRHAHEPHAAADCERSELEQALDEINEAGLRRPELEEALGVLGDMPDSESEGTGDDEAVAPSDSALSGVSSPW